MADVELEHLKEEKPKKKPEKIKGEQSGSESSDDEESDSVSESKEKSKDNTENEEKTRDDKKPKEVEKVEEKAQWRPATTGIRGFLDFFIGMRMILWENKICILLLVIPFALASYAVWSPTATFILCMISIIPLAKLLGSATEELAMYTNQTIGGLLNATFGNAVELILSIVALKDGLLRVVQASLLGSILSNLLLVLGMSFFVGGLRYKVQRFNMTASQVSTSLLLQSVMGVTMPAAFFLTNSATVGGVSLTADELQRKELVVSRGAAIVMLCVYASYLIFQLKTHQHLYEEGSGAKDENKDEKKGEKEKAKEEEEEEVPKLSWWGAVLLLTIVTAMVAILSEFLVGSIEHVTEAWGVSETFVGVILLPVVGNAAEHVTAVTVAYKNKMDLSVGVAIGSSVQIALLVIPVLVLLGWIIGQPLSLYFYAFETIVLLLAVIIVNAIIGDGESNWLEGTLLMATYVVIAIGFFFHG